MPETVYCRYAETTQVSTVGTLLDRMCTLFEQGEKEEDYIFVAHLRVELNGILRLVIGE